MRGSHKKTSSSTTLEPSTKKRSSERANRRIGWRVVVGATVVLIAWLAVGSVGGQFTGKLSGLQKNDTASFLPASAESTKVVEQAKAFSDDPTLPMIVVAERSGGLRPGDLATAQAFAKALPGRTLKLGAETKRISDYLTTPAVVAVPSKDGKAVLIVASLNGPKVSANGSGNVSPLDVINDDVRAATKDELRAKGLTAYVTGPAGFIGDLGAAFAGIDGILLLVALSVVLVILLIVYRSPVLPFAVLLTAVFGLSGAGFLVYQMADAGWITVSGQSQGILSILVVGAATDYALLLVSRYKEELHDEESTWQALKSTWRATVAPILASGLTVALGLLALLLADLKSTSGLGPVGALGILGALAAALTFLPAVLVLGRRWIFWPAIPRADHVRVEDRSGRFGWHRVAALVGRHPRRTWVVNVFVLLAAAAFLPTLKANGISQQDIFRTKVDSVTGQKILARHFDAGAGSPIQVITPQDKAPAVLARLTSEKDVSKPYAGVTPGVPPKVVDGRVLIQASLAKTADSPAAVDTVKRVRADLTKIDGSILVGGQSAQSLDTRDAADHDLVVVVPTIIAIVFLILCLLLRSLVAPVLLVLANILSFGATMGIAALVFNHVFGFPGGDPTTVLYGFVFLVALGVDYSIFLMTRAREEAQGFGARKGVLRALTVTGGVITSAGIVLAATFGSLTVIPLVFLAEIAFIVSFGVLLDTLVVRSLLVPALAADLGERTWWPSRLGKHVPAEPEELGN